MVDGEDCAKRVAMGFGVGAALGSSIGAHNVSGGLAARRASTVADGVRRANECCATLPPFASSPDRPHNTTQHTTATQHVVGALYGTYGAFRYKVPGLFKIRYIGQNTVTTGAAFGVFLAAGSFLQCYR